MSGGRFEFDGVVVHKDGQQFVNGRAFYNDAYTRRFRIETAGFASVPIKGAQGLVLKPNRDADQAYIFGGEHPGHRPDLPSGGTAIYDHNGNIIKLVGEGAVFDFGTRTATLTAGNWIINGPVTLNGNVTVNGNLHATGSITDGDGDGGA